MEGITYENMATDSRYTYEDYTVGWISTLPVELAASIEMLDEIHPKLYQDPQDHNHYTLGNIGEHNVVIACLPSGRTGLVSATEVAMQMRLSFKSIRFGLMVGVGGGVPSEEVDIRLGDVVISRPFLHHPGVVQYDLGKTGPAGQYVRTGSLNSPPQILLNAITAMEADSWRGQLDITKHVQALCDRLPKFAYPHGLEDKLFRSDYVHQEGRTCKQCGNDELVAREEREGNDVAIHYGTIASGNQVIKDGVTRDRLSQDLNGVLCFEMEAAGLMNNFPCLVIRGICDYCDSHKSKGWQPYAATTASGFAKELLNYVVAAEVVQTPALDEVMAELSSTITDSVIVSRRVEKQIITAEEERILDWLSAFDFSGCQNTALACQTPDTGKWILEDPRYVKWRESSHEPLWLFGVAGCGKTVLCSTIIRDLQERLHGPPDSGKLVYWYFQFSNSYTFDICNMLRSFIRQLETSPVSASIRHVWDCHKSQGSQPSLEELQNLLFESISGLVADVFIVIDALDECPDASQNSGRAQVLQFIKQLHTISTSKLHILVTSRWDTDIAELLQDIATEVLDVEPLIKGDVGNFVSRAMQLPRLSRWGASITSQVEGRLLSSHERRFRWADLQIRRLQECATDDQMRNALNTIPETLESTYKECLEKIPSQNRAHVRQILIWLTTSFRPLSSLEVAAAVGFPFQDDVLRICPSVLVTITEEDRSQVVRIAHFSVKEFLITRDFSGEALPWYRFSPQVAHSDIATRTLEFLTSPQCLALLQEKDRFKVALLHYSACFWTYHVSKSEGTDISNLQELIDALFDTSTTRDYYHNWLQVDDPDTWLFWIPGKDGSPSLGHYRRSLGMDPPDYRYLPKRDGYPQPIYYAALLGLKSSVIGLWKGDFQLKLEEGRWENALCAAARGGSVDIVRWLVHHCHDNIVTANLSNILRVIDVNTAEILSILIPGKQRLVTADHLTAAAKNRYSEEAMLFLMNQTIAEEQHLIDVVVTAAENSGKGVQIMEVLLKDPKMAEIAQDEEVLRTAIWNDQHAIPLVSLLLDCRPTDVDLTEDDVANAAAHPDLGMEFLQLFTEKRGSKIPITEAVILAAAGASSTNGEAVLDLLLRWRTEDVPITEEVVFALTGNLLGNSMITLLLDQQAANFEVVGEVVELIAANFDPKVFKSLLEQRGADIQITEQVLKSVALHQDSEVMAWLLQYRGKDIQITEEIIVAGAGNDEPNTVRLLLDQAGAEYQITKEVVWAAATSGNEENLLLVEQRWHSGVRDKTLCMVNQLFRAARRHDEVSLSELLKSDINLNVRDMSNKSPLWWTVWNEDCQTTNMLLEKGDVDVNIQEFVTGETPLHGSIWFDEDETDIVKKLLNAGADPGITNAHGQTAYDLAMRHYQWDHANTMEMYEKAPK